MFENGTTSPLYFLILILSFYQSSNFGYYVVRYFAVANTDAEDNIIANSQAHRWEFP